MAGHPVHGYHSSCDAHTQLRTYLADFPAAYTFTGWLKTLGGLIPHEYICEISTSEPD